MICPGALMRWKVCETGKDRVVLKSRKGIIKYCLQPGAEPSPPIPEPEVLDKCELSVLSPLE